MQQEHAIIIRTESRIPAGEAVEGGHSKRKREPVAERQWRVANAAYYLAEKRGFEPGGELDDWFTAESLIAAAPPGERG